MRRGPARSAVSGRSAEAGVGSATFCPNTPKPFTRRSCSWKPAGPPKLNCAAPEIEKVSVSCPSIGIDSDTVARRMSTLIVPFGARVNTVSSVPMVSTPPKAKARFVALNSSITPSGRLTDSSCRGALAGAEGTVAKLIVSLIAVPELFTRTVMLPVATSPSTPTMVAVPSA